MVSSHKEAGGAEPGPARAPGCGPTSQYNTGFSRTKSQSHPGAPKAIGARPPRQRPVLSWKPRAEAVPRALTPAAGGRWSWGAEARVPAHPKQTYTCSLASPASYCPMSLHLFEANLKGRPHMLISISRLQFFSKIDLVQVMYAPKR